MLPGVSDEPTGPCVSAAGGTLEGGTGDGFSDGASRFAQAESKAETSRIQTAGLAPLYLMVTPHPTAGGRAWSDVNPKGLCLPLDASCVARVNTLSFHESR